MMVELASSNINIPNFTLDEGRRDRGEQKKSMATTGRRVKRKTQTWRFRQFR
jgi:hypothetical protein